MLVFSAADFEDFRQPRPDMPPEMETELEDVLQVLIANRWPWRLHATYDETITRALDVFEAVNRDMPIDGLHWILDHCETNSDRNIDRVAALGGGIAIQHRMAFQGEDFSARYGREALERTPPVRRMIDAGVRVGAGTDATRVASYNPWVSFAWLVTGRTLSGLQMYPVRNRLSREAALELWTVSNTWFSTEESKKGQIKVGQLADLAVLDRDVMRVPEDHLAHTSSVLTLLGGEVVYGADEFRSLAPELPPAMPDWSPVRAVGNRRHLATKEARSLSTACDCSSSCAVHVHDHAWALAGPTPAEDDRSFWGALGCSCWAV
jgi:predicted amidohydrolase YtcJ